MECAALVVGEIITFVIGHEVDDGPFGKGRRLIEDQASSRHGLGEGSCGYCRGFRAVRQAFHAAPTEFADVAEARNHLCFQTFV